MDLNKYQEEAMATLLPSANNHFYMLTGLTGEVGELNSLFAKWTRDDTPYPELMKNYKKELGDILWFIAGLAKVAGLTLEEVAQGNLDKLAKRKATGTLQGSGDDREDDAWDEKRMDVIGQNGNTGDCY